MSTLTFEADKRLHDQGMRMTSQRRLILDTLSKMESHPTAEEVYTVVRQQDSSLHLSTVYRTLRWLETEGLIQSRQFGAGLRQERFDPILDGEHYHFYCQSCHQVIEFNTLLVNAIKAQFELHSGAEVDYGTVILYGRCAECRETLEE